jgi:cytochrome c biogenesis protein CcmG/thiol:disulfide interchange protein DsbE
MIRKTIIAAASVLLLIASPSFAGDDLDLSEYRGKVVVLDFWASWCVPCRRSFPWWNAMHAKYADEGLVIVGVNLDNESDSAAEFLKEFPADFQIHYDLQKELAKRFGVQAMPSSYILGRDGEIFKKHFGFKVKQQDEFEALLIEALRSGAQ